VSARYLSKIGEELRLCDYLIASRKVKEQILVDPSFKDGILDDLFESVLGAISRIADLEFCMGTGNLVVYNIIEHFFNKFSIGLKWLDLVHPISIIKEIYDATPDIDGVKVEWKQGTTYCTYLSDHQNSNPWTTVIYYPFRTKVKRENVIATSYGPTDSASLVKAVRFAIGHKLLKPKVNNLIPDPFVIGRKMYEERQQDEPGISQYNRYLKLINGDTEELNEEPVVEELGEDNLVENPTPVTTIHVSQTFTNLVKLILTEGKMETTHIEAITDDVLLMRELVCSCISTSKNVDVQIIHELSLYEGIGLIDAIVIDHILSTMQNLFEKSVNDHKQNIMSHDNFNAIVSDEFKDAMLVHLFDYDIPNIPNKKISKERLNVLFKAFLGCLCSIIDRSYLFGVGFRVIHTFLTSRLSKVDLTRDESIGSLTKLYIELGWGSLVKSYEYEQTTHTNEDETTTITHHIRLYGTPKQEKILLAQGAGRNKKHALQIACKEALHVLKTRYNIHSVHRTTRTTTTSHMKKPFVSYKNTRK
jgi:dsRNA-specific ribonuclease